MASETCIESVLIELPRKDLQRLAKAVGVKANGKSADIVAHLVELHGTDPTAFDNDEARALLPADSLSGLLNTASSKEVHPAAEAKPDATVAVDAPAPALDQPIAGSDAEAAVDAQQPAQGGVDSSEPEQPNLSETAAKMRAQEEETAQQDAPDAVAASSKEDSPAPASSPVAAQQADIAGSPEPVHQAAQKPMVTATEAAAQAPQEQQQVGEKPMATDADAAAPAAQEQQQVGEKPMATDANAAAPAAQEQQQVGEPNCAAPSAADAAFSNPLFDEDSSGAEGSQGGAAATGGEAAGADKENSSFRAAVAGGETVGGGKENSSSGAAAALPVNKGLAQLQSEGLAADGSWSPGGGPQDEAARRAYERGRKSGLWQGATEVQMNDLESQWGQFKEQQQVNSSVRRWAIPNLQEVRAKASALKDVGFTTVNSPFKGGTKRKAGDLGGIGTAQKASKAGKGSTPAGKAGSRFSSRAKTPGKGHIDRAKQAEEAFKARRAAALAKKQQR